MTVAPSPDRIVLTPEAEEDLAAFLAYLDARNPAAAVAAYSRIVDAFALLAAPSPRLDGPAALLRSGRRCRRFPVAPVTVFYEREPGVVTVLRVYHHAREPLTRA